MNNLLFSNYTYKENTMKLLPLFNKHESYLWIDQASRPAAVHNVREALRFVDEKTTTLQEAIDSYKKYLTKMYECATINRKLINLKTALNYLYKREKIEEPFPEIKLVSVSNERERTFSKEEANRIFTWFHSKGLHEEGNFYEILYETGMRFGELQKVTPKHVQGNWIVLSRTETKTKRLYKIPLSLRAEELLQTTLPFTKTQWEFRKAWEAMRKDLGFQDDPEFVPHVFRHTFATNLLRKTRDLKVVGKLLNHKCILSTNRYAKVLDDDLLNCVR